MLTGKYRFSPEAKRRNRTAMNTGMKDTIILACGLGGTPIWPTFDRTNIESPITIGMM